MLLLLSFLSSSTEAWLYVSEGQPSSRFGLSIQIIGKQNKIVCGDDYFVFDQMFPFLIMNINQIRLPPCILSTYPHACLAKIISNENEFRCRDVADYIEISCISYNLI